MSATATMPEKLTDYRIMLCGKATFTLECSGKHYTYRVTRKDPKANSNATDPVFFVSLLTGPDNTNDYKYIGMIQPRTGRFVVTKKSIMTMESDPCKGIRWLAARWFNNQPIPDAVRVLWADRCQRCGRVLTVPSSIDARLGPECAGRV